MPLNLKCQSGLMARASKGVNILDCSSGFSLWFSTYPYLVSSFCSSVSSHHTFPTLSPERSLPLDCSEWTGKVTCLTTARNEAWGKYKAFLFLSLVNPEKLTFIICQQGRLYTWLGILATLVRQSFQPKL